MSATAQDKVDPNLKSYQPVAGISGVLNGKGSDTLNNMMDLWVKGFMRVYPNVQATYLGEGSSTAPPALIEGTAQLGPMSRDMKPEEEEAIEQKYGVKPIKIAVGLDCLAVFVHKDNPVKALTLQQLDCIFSSTRKSGFADISSWGQVNKTLAANATWQKLPLSLYGRNSASGTYVYFKEKALFKGDFKNTVKEQPGSAGVVNGVSSDLGGIGYSGVGYRTADVRMVPIAKDPKAAPVEPTFENALNGTYSLARAMYIYVVKKPNEPLPPLVHEFLKYTLSKEGQEIVVQDGFGPLPLTVVNKELKKLQ